MICGLSVGRLRLSKRSFLAEDELGSVSHAIDALRRTRLQRWKTRLLLETTGTPRGSPRFTRRYPSLPLISHFISLNRGARGGGRAP